MKLNNKYIVSGLDKYHTKIHYLTQQPTTKEKAILIKEVAKKSKLFTSVAISKYYL